jgi:hypothetical protein
MKFLIIIFISLSLFGDCEEYLESSNYYDSKASTDLVTADKFRKISQKYRTQYVECVKSTEENKTYMGVRKIPQNTDDIDSLFDTNSSQ